MRIYNVTLTLLHKGETRETKEMFVLGDNDDPREFAQMVYAPMDIDVLRVNAEEVDQSFLKVSKNALAPYKKRYFNEN